MEVVGQRQAHSCFTSGNGPVSTHLQVGGPQGRFERVWKMLSRPGFDPRTAQPVARRYTTSAILTHIYV
jgi:hypothetical protein